MSILSLSSSSPEDINPDKGDRQDEKQLIQHNIETIADIIIYIYKYINI